MGNVVYLDELRPHIHLVGRNCQRVIPCLLIEDIISGKTKIEDVEDWEGLVIDIISCWYDEVEDGL